MNKFFPIILFFPLLFVGVLMLTLVSYNAQAVNEMQEIMVRDAADAANDAAIYEARRIAHVDMYGKTTLDPERVWDEYKYTFLRALDIYSDKNMERFEAYCPATVIAVNDGYFIRMRTLDSEGQVTVQFTQKIPYAREANGGGTTAIVADTMNGMYIYGFVPSANHAVVWGEDAPVASLKGSVHDTSAIALELIKAMDYCIEIENAAVTNNLWDKQKFYIPKELLDTVYYDAVSFKGLSLLNLIQGFDMKSTRPVDYFTISNTQLVVSKQYACYDFSGKKYYSPVDDKINHLPEANIANSKVVVSSKIEAAKLGYFPDPRYYQIP